MRNQFRISISTWLTFFSLGFLIGLFILRRRNRQAGRQYTGPVPPSIPATAHEEQPHYSQDATRADFLRRLDNAPFVLSQWGVGFLENNIGRVCYTAGQRMAIDGLRRKYQSWL